MSLRSTKKKNFKLFSLLKCGDKFFKHVKILPSQHNSLFYKYFQLLTFLMVGLSLKWVHFIAQAFNWLIFKCLKYLMYTYFHFLAFILKFWALPCENLFNLIFIFYPLIFMLRFNNFSILISRMSLWLNPWNF